jgi:hypothetical protein
MTNATFPMTAGTISPVNTNPAIQDVPPHSHPGGGTRWVVPAPGYTAQSLAYFNTMNTNPTYAAQPFTVSNPNSGAASTGDGVHSHAVTFSQTFSSPTAYNNTNFNVKYTDLILAYKTPTGIKTYTASLDNNKTSFTEGDMFRINLYASTNVPLGKKFIFNIVGISATVNDFYTNEGTLTLTSTYLNTHTGYVDIISDIKYTATGSKYFKYEIIDPAIGSSVFMSGPIEIKDYYKEWYIDNNTNAITNGINEGATVTFYYTLATGSSLIGYWRIKHGGTGGVLSNASDFIGATSGSVGPKANVNDRTTYPITIQLSNDITTEFGGEDFAFECSDTSDFAVIRFTSINYHINDTSRLTVITFVNPSTSVNEGQTVTYTVNSTGSDNGTVLYWNIAFDGGLTSSDFDISSGSFTLTVNQSTGVGTASFSFTIRNDSLTEGSETFTIQIRRNTVLTGELITTGPTITIADTSKTPTFSWSSVPAEINEGTNFTIGINVTEFPVGNNFTYEITNGESTNTTQPTKNTDFIYVSRSFATQGSFASSSGSFRIYTASGTRDTGDRKFTLNVKRNDTSAVVLTKDITLYDNNREPQGQVEFTRNTAGGTYINNTSDTRFGQGGGPYFDFAWTVPSGVYSISVVCIGAAGGYGGVGGGGGGGALCYRNYIDVTPGEVLSIHVGATGSYGYSGAPTSATYGGQSLVQTSKGIMAFAGGGYGGYGVSGWSGGSFGLTRLTNIQSDKTGTLIGAMTSNATSISINMSSGNAIDILSWASTGYIIIDSELIRYNSRLVISNIAYLTFLAGGRGIKQYTTSPPTEAGHAAGAIVKYFPGYIFPGGTGGNGTSTTRGAQGGAGQFSSAGGTGTGVGTSTGQTGGAVWGSASGNNGGGAVRIMWGGYYRSYPSTNTANAPMLSWVSVPTSMDERTTSSTFNVNATDLPVGNSLIWQLEPDYSKQTAVPYLQAAFDEQEFINPTAAGFPGGSRYVQGNITTTGTTASSTGSFTITHRQVPSSNLRFNSDRDAGPKSFLVNIRKRDTDELVLSTPMTLNDNLREPTGDIKFDINTTGYGKTYNISENSYQFTWTKPAGVHSCCIIVVGAGGYGTSFGGGGGGGAVMYYNNVDLYNASTVTVNVGAPGSQAVGRPFGEILRKGGDSVVILSSGNRLGAGGGYGGSAVAPYSGGAGGTYYSYMTESDYSQRLEFDLDATFTGKIYFDQVTQSFELMYRVPKQGTAKIDNEFIKYSDAGFDNSNGRYRLYITISQRGVAYYPGVGGATTHLANSILYFLMGEFYPGGNGATGTATALGNYGGAAQRTRAGTNGSGTGGSNGEFFADGGNYGANNQGGVVHIMWGGYYRKYP